MRKSDKKIDNKIRYALTQVCENALKNVAGFNWLTHVVDYNNFPSSLTVICIFESQSLLEQACENPSDNDLINQIEDALKHIDIKFKNSHQHILFDTEDDYQIEKYKP